MKLIAILIVSLSLLACGEHEKVETTKSFEKSQAPRNIIFMVGDGMGLAQISSAMQLDGRVLNLERAPVIGLIKTHSSNEQITDSAASATAFATGKKARNGSIGIDENGRSQQTILEFMAAEKYSTGVIATSTITHATPASFFAHQPSRQLYYSIAADMIKAPVNLFIGGGKKHFHNRNDPQLGKVDDRDLIQELEDVGFSFVNNIKQLNNTDGRVGFFLADGHPEPVLKGRGDILPKLITPSIGSLQKQTEVGFFLMVEGAQIDWGGHANDFDYVISELYDFDDAIGQALDFAEADTNTLVVITADHETGGLTLPPRDKESAYPYAEATHHFSTMSHTSTMVPVFAYGPGSELFSGVYDNTEIHSKMLEALKR